MRDVETRLDDKLFLFLLVICAFFSCLSKRCTCFGYLVEASDRILHAFEVLGIDIIHALHEFQINIVNI